MVEHFKVHAVENNKPLLICTMVFWNDHFLIFEIVSVLPISRTETIGHLYFFENCAFTDSTESPLICVCLLIFGENAKVITNRFIEDNTLLEGRYMHETFSFFDICVDSIIFAIIFKDGIFIVARFSPKRVLCLPLLPNDGRFIASLALFDFAETCWNLRPFRCDCLERHIGDGSLIYWAVKPIS